MCMYGHLREMRLITQEKQFVEDSGNLTNQAEEKNNPESYLNRPAILHQVLRPLELPLNSSIPAIKLLIITIITTIQATLTSFIAYNISLLEKIGIKSILIRLRKHRNQKADFKNSLKLRKKIKHTP